jgi:glycosyltransferase involved in cell wall biosynthesis
MRIEMLLPSMPRAGMEVMAAALGKGLAARGHDVGFTCIIEPGALGEDLRAEGFRVSVVQAPGLRPNLLPRELGPWLTKLRPDVAHIHSGLWLKAAVAARYACVPRIVHTLHGVGVADPWYLRWLHRAAAARTDLVVAVAASLGHYVTKALGVPESKVRVILNGVSTRRYAPRPAAAALRSQLEIPQGAFVVGNVARMHPVKNHSMLLDAFAQLRQECPEAFLLLVGDGAQRGALERQIEALGLEPHVRITGVVDDTAPLLNQMDLFVLSSLIEGTSMSLLEAMSSGVPVIATAVGGNPALLGDGSYGILTPAGDAATLAEAMRRVIAEPASVADQVLAARERVVAAHSEEKMVLDYEAAYATEALAVDVQAST